MEERVEEMLLSNEIAPAQTESAVEEMPNLNFEAVVEAILFAAGHPISYEQLGKVLQCSPSYVRERVQNFAVRYNNSDTSRGVMLLAFDDCCQLCTKEDYLPYIREALGIRRNGNLSNSSIETLAIIAYNQPVTRSYVDTVRGVDSSYAVSSLLERGLIEAKGRLDAPGRPMLYVTTDKFLRVFGLNSLSELPETEALSIAAAQAEQTEELTEEQAEQALPEGEYTEVSEDDSRAEV